MTNDTASAAASAWPTDLTLNAEKNVLTVSFDDGAKFDLSAEYLRVTSPSAEVQGHSPDQRKTVGGKQDVQIMQLEPTGNYAVRITFDDMHNTGLFTWAYLYTLGAEQEIRWQAYLEELADKGLSRAR
ncbi:MAG: DUF971 domain-containing protein [Pseudomonadota bacterium]